VTAVSSPTPNWPISTLQPGWSAGIRAQRLIQRRELSIERVDHAQRDLDLRARSAG
jgi:hypothetical protein